ncbi:Abi family protein [Teichococcus aestuarii]|uniref:Abi family protein n=1 Tax=Teichococcus aestuarii TaxID=568898 RepID=UPI001FE5E0C8
MELYALNTALSEALYTPLQMLEVALRNRFHTTLSAAYGLFWFDAPDFLKVGHQVEQVQKAKELLTEQGKPLEPGRIVAALTFGFWTALLNTVYEDLWRSTLHQAMQPDARDEKGRGLSRKSLTRPLTPLRELRNRVAHHEPILEWNLPKHHANIVRITGWLSPAAKAWTHARSRFLSVYPAQPIALAKQDAQGCP